MTEIKKKRVVVAMSGGVDSAVAAGLLKDQGYEVIGISLKLWDYDEPDRKPTSKTCCSFEDISDARQVCDRIGIPFYAFNYKKHFEENVVQRFVSAYHTGTTPNPCILCNQFVKFDRLMDEALKLKADFLATGHYARLDRSNPQDIRLLKGCDAAKDQSYVLFALTQQTLQKVLFPIGDFQKSEIRELARKYNMPVADKHESQDICFIPNNDYAKFIEKNYPSDNLKAGNFVDHHGKILGTHDGIHAYTVGQRRGLGVAFSERLYVTRIDPLKNEVELGIKEETLRAGCVAGRVNFIGPIPTEAVQLGVKIRYQKDEIPALVSYEPTTQKVKIVFHEKRGGVTPGQAAVFYNGDEVIGGGWIEKVL